MNKSVLFFASIAFLLFAPVAEAQFAMSAGANVYAGGGAYFGQGSCSGGNSGGTTNLPPEILDKNNDVQNINKDIKDIKKSIRDDKGHEKDARQGYDKDHNVLCNWFRNSDAYGVCGAIEKWEQTGQAGAIDCTKGNNVAPWKGLCHDENLPANKQNNNIKEEADNAVDTWTNQNSSIPSVGTDGYPDPKMFCDANGLITADSRSRKEEANSDDSSDYKYSKYLHGAGGGTYSKQDCEDALGNYRVDWKAYSDAKTQLATDQLALKGADRELKQAEEDRSSAVNDYAESIADGDTSAQICWSCLNGSASQGPSTLDKVLPLVGSVLGMGLTYATVHYTDQQNAALGWPTNPWMGYQMAYPFAMAGIYGAMNAGNGCSMGGPGGAFGYPSGYYNPYGGGMSPYMMSPYNMNPYGMNPMMGQPGMGYMSPYAMMSGMTTPGMVGIGIGGAVAGMVPGMGYMGPGYGSITPMMSMMSPGMTSPYGSLSPYGMMTGMMSPGMISPYGSLSPYGMMTGMMSPGMMSPYATMNPMMNSGYMTMMMQQQQQQMAIQMQQMQDYENRQMVVGQLGQQLMQIQMQMQEIEMGGATPGLGGLGGLTGGASPFGYNSFGALSGTTGLYPTGYTTNPYGTSTYGTLSGTTNYTGPARGQGYGVPTAF